MKEFDEMTKEEQEYIKKLVIARLQSMPDTIKVSLG